MHLLINDGQGAVHVSVFFEDAVDWQITRVTGSVRCIDTAGWAAARSIAPTLGGRLSIAETYKCLSNGYYSFAAAAHFGAWGTSLDMTPHLETAVELADRCEALPLELRGSLADILIGVVMERSIARPRLPIEPAEWLQIEQRLLIAAAAMDTLSRAHLTGAA